MYNTMKDQIAILEDFGPVASKHNHLQFSLIQAEGHVLHYCNTNNLHLPEVPPVAAHGRGLPYCDEH